MYVLVAVQRTLNLFTDNFQWLHFKMVLFSITSGFEVKFRKKLISKKWGHFICLIHLSYAKVFVVYLKSFSPSSC